MYMSFNDLRGFTLTGEAGEIGRVQDVYFDDRSWQANYIVIETGGWFSSNKILVDTSSVSAFDFTHNQLKTSMDKPDVENAPPASSRETVSEANERAWILEPSNQVYIAGVQGTILPPLLYGKEAGPSATSTRQGDGEAQPEKTRHLRSADEVTGYAISASDGRIGSLCDLIVDPSDWKLAYLSIDTGNWLPGKLVILPPRLAGAISWRERSVTFDMTKQQVEDSPPLSGLEDLERGHEELLYAHYGYPMM